MIIRTGRWILAVAFLAARARADVDEIARWIARLGDDALAVREEASRRLVEIGNDRPEAVLARLETVLASEDPETRDRARALEREVSWVRHKRTARAAAGDDPDAASLVERLFRRDEEGGRELARLVPLLGRDRAAPVVGAFLDHPDPGVRRTAIFLLCDLGASAFGGRAAAMIMDPDINVRLAAIDATGRLRHRAALETLGGLLEQLPEDWMKAMRGNMYYAHQAGLARAIRSIAGPSWNDPELARMSQALPPLPGLPPGQDDGIRKARAWWRLYRDGKIPDWPDAGPPVPPSPPAPDEAEDADADDFLGE